MVINALVLSSSVISGLVINLSQQGLLSLEAGIAIIVGYDIGTSSTALIASINM